MPEYNIAVPSNKIFQSADIKREPPRLMLIEKIEYPEEGGVLISYKDSPFPRKIAVRPDSCFAVFNAKRFFIEQIKFFTSRPIVYFIGLFCLLAPKRLFEKVAMNYIRSFLETTDHILSSYYFKSKFFCKSGRELFRVFAMRYVQSKEWYRALFFILMVWELDEQYRFRGQDFFCLLDKEAFLKDYKKELKRVVKIMVEREEIDEVKVKLNRLFKAGIFLISRRKWLKNQLMFLVRNLDFEKVRFDEGDKWWTTARVDYRYGGMTREERIKKWR